MTVKRVNYKGGKKIPALTIYVQSMLRYFAEKYYSKKYYIDKYSR